MSSYKNKIVVENEEGLIEMVSLMDVAFFKWTDKAAGLLDRQMLQATPKKLSSRALAKRTEKTNYPVSYQTINKMRKGETSEVSPENLIGVSKALDLDIAYFLMGRTAIIRPGK